MLLLKNILQIMLICVKLTGRNLNFRQNLKYHIRYHLGVSSESKLYVNEHLDAELHNFSVIRLLRLCQLHNNSVTFQIPFKRSLIYYFLYKNLI